MTAPCPDCGGRKRPESTRCARCASELDAAATTECRNCGRALSAGAVACGRCGQGVSADAPLVTRRPERAAKPPNLALILSIAAVAILVAVLAPQYLPRYVEEGPGVRDRWTGELCRWGPYPFQDRGWCEAGPLRNRDGRWVREFR